MERSTEPSHFLEKILNSHTFLNKEVQKNLLCFLYEASREGRNLKEIDIAFDFFKRGKTFLPGEDTIVRVSIYKLRALLEKYYQNEGAKDELFFDLPKGCYSLKVDVHGQKKGKSLKQPNRKIGLYMLLAISFMLNLFLVFRNEFRSKPVINPVWNSYLKSKQPVYITLGNPFFFQAANDSLNENLIIRDISINSIQDLAERKLNHFFIPNTELGELDYPYLTTNNLRPLPDIISFFSKSDIEIRLQTLSETPIEEVKRNNQIFIGNINSFGFFTKFLEPSSISLRTNPRVIVVDKGTDSLVLRVPEKVNGYYIDYAFLVKVPGLNHTILSMMGDFHASGIKGLSHFITDTQSISGFETKVNRDYGHFPEFFEMVVKVTSYNYIDFETEVLYFKPLLF